MLSSTKSFHGRPRRRRVASTCGSENRQSTDAGIAFTEDNQVSLFQRLLDDVEVPNDQVGELFDSPTLDPSDVRTDGRAALVDARIVPKSESAEIKVRFSVRARSSTDSSGAPSRPRPEVCTAS